MYKQALKVATVVATTAVAIPYAVALLTHIMWGWPRNYKRALAPRKVFALNYSLLMEVKKLKYAVLKLRWIYFYKNAKSNRLIKDLSYGSHGNNLDLYLPVDREGHLLPGPRPIVIFLYGGTWSSGDKSMYGMLCSQLADNCQALVCCPNYTLYPRGLVDDMVQDVVDCLDWMQGHAERFGGDKNRVALIGHSAGGHLALLAVLELVQKCLIHNPSSIIMSMEEATMMASQNLSRQTSAFSQSFVFEEGYFDTSESEDEEHREKKLSSAGSESFFVVDKSARQREESGNSQDEKPDNFVVVGEESNGSASDREGGSIGSMEEVDIPTAESEDEEEENNDKDDSEGKENEKSAEEEKPEAEGVESSKCDEKTAEGKSYSGDRDPETSAEVAEVKKEEIPESRQDEEGNLRLDLQGPEEAGSTESPPQILIDTGTPLWTPTQLTGSLASVKVIIGLAGVYNIGDHYKHESWRGVEDVSNMARAMFGPQHFDRFSPTFIVQHLPKNTRIPAVQLIHGDKDEVVPDSSSMKLGKALWDLGSRNVQYSVIPNCDHFEICLDLMDTRRDWYSVVMGEILRATNFYLRPTQ